MGGVLGLVQVDQSTVAIKEKFGKFNAVLEPGCHFLPWCIGDRIVGYLSLRVKTARCPLRNVPALNSSSSVICIPLLMDFLNCRSSS